MNKKKIIAEYIKDNWTNEEIIKAYNHYAESNHYERIEVNDEYVLNSLFSSADEAIRATYYGDYKYTDNYLVFNGNGNLNSFDYWDDDNSPICIAEIADWLEDNGDADFDIGVIDTDYLLDTFLEEYYEEEHREKMRGEIDLYMSENSCDFLTEDWDDLYENIAEAINQYA